MTGKKSEYPSQQLDQYIVRFPDGMRETIKEMAKANYRSMNAEIVSALASHIAATGVVSEAKTPAASRNTGNAGLSNVQNLTEA